MRQRGWGGLGPFDQPGHLCRSEDRAQTTARNHDVDGTGVFPYGATDGHLAGVWLGPAGVTRQP